MAPTSPRWSARSTALSSGTDVTVDVGRFPAIFAGDVEDALAKTLAVSQRPLAGAAFTEKASAAAWKTKPSWGSVATADHTINPDVERFGYQRAGTTVTEIDSSHLVMLSPPQGSRGHHPHRD
jgi:hypothetical protein